MDERRESRAIGLDIVRIGDAFQVNIDAGVTFILRDFHKLREEGVPVGQDGRACQRRIEVIQRLAAVVADAGVGRDAVFVSIICRAQVIVLDDRSIVLHVEDIDGEHVKPAGVSLQGGVRFLIAGEVA